MLPTCAPRRARLALQNAFHCFVHSRRAHHLVTVADAFRLRQEKDIVVQGWIRTVRKQRKRAFAEIGDGSTLDSLQAVLDPQDASQLSTGAAVSVSGTWTPSPDGKEQAWELHAKKANLLGDNDAANCPLQKKYQTPEFLRTIPHLRLRTPMNALWLRVRSQAITAANRFFDERDYVQTHTPIITSSDCEGAGEVFQASPPGRDELSGHFFGDPKYLTVSAQLHLEAVVQSVGRVWTLSPTFRAEPSDTARHLSEFYMLEAEVAFIDKLEDIMGLVEGLTKSIAQGVYESATGKELLRNGIAETRRQELMKECWTRISYHDAICFLEAAQSSGRANFEHSPRKTGLSTEHERFIAARLGNGGPVFVTDYPAHQKAFYMAPSPIQDKSEPTVACFDLLLPEMCEVAGGSMREHRLQPLREAMRLRNIGQQGELDWYLDLRRYGSVEHGGFGLGFDRLLCYLIGANNVRDVATFPRWSGRCMC